MHRDTATWWTRPLAWEATGWARTRERRQYRLSPPATRRIVVFADPDTLRGGDHASLVETRHTLDRLADRGVSVVLWGNETRAEMELIRADLGLRHPFISESGGGLFVPDGYFADMPVNARAFVGNHVLDFGRPYPLVASTLHQVASELKIAVNGFSGMSVQEVATDCRLSLAQARLATLREYDEPFRIVDTNPAVQNRLFQGLRRAGLRGFTHEAYHHATGVTDKTESVRTLTSLYRQGDDDILTVGIARDADEIGLLQAVDVALVIQSGAVDAARLLRKVPTARLTDDGSPRAWGGALWDVIDGE